MSAFQRHSSQKLGAGIHFGFSMAFADGFLNYFGCLWGVARWLALAQLVARGHTALGLSRSVLAKHVRLHDARSMAAGHASRRVQQGAAGRNRAQHGVQGAGSLSAQHATYRTEHVC